MGIGLTSFQRSSNTSLGFRGTLHRNVIFLMVFEVFEGRREGGWGGGPRAIRAVGGQWFPDWGVGRAREGGWGCHCHCWAASEKQCRSRMHAGVSEEHCPGFQGCLPSSSGTKQQQQSQLFIKGWVSSFIWFEGVQAAEASVTSHTAD
jgi:hypothetical protein